MEIWEVANFRRALWFPGGYQQSPIDRNRVPQFDNIQHISSTGNPLVTLNNKMREGHREEPATVEWQVDWQHQATNFHCSRCLMRNLRSHEEFEVCKLLKWKLLYPQKKINEEAIGPMLCRANDCVATLEAGILARGGCKLDFCIKHVCHH